MALTFKPTVEAEIDPALLAMATEAEASILRALAEHGSHAKAAKALGCCKSNVSSAMRRLRKRVETPATPKPWAVATPAVVAATVPSVRGPVSRTILTSAQDDTDVHLPFWNNLHAFAKAIGARVIVGGWTYQKGLYEDHATRTAAFRSEVHPFIAHENIDLGPVIFFAKMNILPTAVKPLSGLETMARGKFGVFPHAKIQLTSVPSTVSGYGFAHQMTTGACTLPNYIAKKAGQKAEFHHQIGATLVEIDAEGDVFCRQIAAADDGSFQDLDIMVRDGRVTAGHRIDTITHGDIHREKLDSVVAKAVWGIDLDEGRVVTDQNMVDTLRPRHQILHDLLDFMARNHHRKGDHHFKFKMLQSGTDRIEAEVRDCAAFVRLSERPWCVSVVVPSNHNDALERWLREADPREDPANAHFWFRANAAIYEAIERNDEGFDVFRWALAQADARAMEDIVFPPRGGSYVVCQASGGIECAIHGDQGINGARGSPNNLLRVATRMNTGHAHSPSILDGIYTAGLCGKMDQGYNNPMLGSWSHTQVIVYPSGKRTLLTLIRGKWRAPPPVLTV